MYETNAYEGMLAETMRVILCGMHVRNKEDGIGIAANRIG